jgi:hypothetical protein
MYLWTLSISPVTPIPIPLATHHLSAAATSQSPRRSLVPAKLLPSSFTSSVQQGYSSGPGGFAVCKHLSSIRISEEKETHTQKNYSSEFSS